MSNVRQLAPAGICKPTDFTARVVHDGLQGSLIVNGREVFAAPPAVLRAVAARLHQAALALEELAGARSGKLITDEAILLRAGVPLSLTGHPAIRAEAEKEAVSNRDLRRYMPGGVKSEEHVPPPAVHHVTPSEKQP